MGDRYNRVHNQNLPQKNTFLPILCSKPSIKDVRLPQCDRRDRSEPFSSDPSSPRIGCMGQVKRNNRVAGLPISHRLILTTKNTVLHNKNSNNVNVGYLKLKKFFSSKNLIASPAATASTRSTSSTTTTAASITTAVGHGCGSRRRATKNSASSALPENENCDSFSIADLDPPLPVIKRVQKPGEGGEMDNLWTRRSGGIVLQSLQIRQTHLPKHRLQITTV